MTEAPTHDLVIVRDRVEGVQYLAASVTVDGELLVLRFPPLPAGAPASTSYAQNAAAAVEAWLTDPWTVDLGRVAERTMHHPTPDVSRETSGADVETP